jgi:hypothetical protein
MAGLVKKRFESSEETRTFDKGKVDIVGVGELSVGRAVFEPGWRWSEYVKPLPAPIRARLRTPATSSRAGWRCGWTTATRSSTGRVTPFYMPPGHDAWIIGDEQCVMLDVTGMTNYAKPALTSITARIPDQTPDPLVLRRRAASPSLSRNEKSDE